MIRILVWFLIAAVVLGCHSREGEYRKGKNGTPVPKAARSDTLVHETSGRFQGTDTYGDYSVLLLRKQTGGMVRFIFVADSILQNEAQYGGKILSVSWREETFEEAGSGEKFQERFLLGVKVLE